MGGNVFRYRLYYRTHSVGSQRMISSKMISGECMRNTTPKRKIYKRQFGIFNANLTLCGLALRNKMSITKKYRDHGCL